MGDLRKGVHGQHTAALHAQKNNKITGLNAKLNNYCSVK
jgi:hypothetical protein